MMKHNEIAISLSSTSIIVFMSTRLVHKAKTNMINGTTFTFGHLSFEFVSGIYRSVDVVSIASSGLAGS